MGFKCQEDSFLREFTSTVTSCEPTKFTLANSKTEIEGYAVTMENTILFPEGGGQPWDTGYINDARVYQVVRKGEIAVHYVDKELTLGQEVKQVIDWDRRMDHMQQHSGQHVITALFEKEFGFPTVSWWLGTDVSYIELDTPKVTEEQIRIVECTCNALIRAGKPVNVNRYSKDAPEARTRGLPADFAGDVRVINIQDVDSSLCCGTHVSNLSQLQVIKLLYTKNSKRKGKIFLYFLIGNRILDRLQGCLANEESLTALLKCNTKEHPQLVEKLQKENKQLTKSLRILLEEMAVAEAKKLKQTNPLPYFFFHHRKEGDLDYLNRFIMEYERRDVLLCLSAGDIDKGGVGQIVLYGPEKDVEQLAPRANEILNGSGFVRMHKFQAKINGSKNLGEVHKLVKEYYEKLNLEKN